VGISRLTGKDDFIKAKLEEGYSFRLLSRELGVSYQTLINYVKGLNKHRGN
jgi:lambda repressor-like predicted transcriptional regulator